MKYTSVLLINFDTCPLAKVYPIGLDYLASVLIDHGFTVDTLDFAFIPADQWYAEAVKKLNAHRYLAIGVGIRNLYDELYGGRNYVPEIISFIQSLKKELSRKKLSTAVIVGGSGFSLMPNTILKQSGADYGITNEGEQAFVDILKQIKRGKVSETSIISKSNNVATARYRRGSWGNFHGYFRAGASGNLQTKRGCTLGCLYCEYPAIEGRTFRFRDPELVAEEYLQLERLGFPRVYIVDATFNNPRDQAKNVLTALKKAKTTIPWTGFFNPRLLDQELIELVKETHGGMPLKMTIESGSDEMLYALRKSFRREHIFEAVKLCKKNGVDFSFTILFGGPGENKTTVGETCALIRETRPASVSMNIGIFLHPKTPLALQTLGKLWKTEDDFINPIIYPCDRKGILSWVENGLSGAQIPYHVYGGGEN